MVRHREAYYIPLVHREMGAPVLFVILHCSTSTQVKGVDMSLIRLLYLLESSRVAPLWSSPFCKYTAVVSVLELRTVVTRHLVVGLFWCLNEVRGRNNLVQDCFDQVQFGK